MELYVVLASIFLFLLATVAIYNKIITSHNRAQRAWSDVLVYERQKLKIVTSLEAQVSSFKEFEADVLKTITGLRSAIETLPMQADGEKLARVQSETRNLIGGLHAVFEAYPDIKAGKIVTRFMNEVVEQEEEVGASITIFNRSVEDFNNLVETFPSSLINKHFNKKASINPFSDVEASSSFDYKPNF